MKILRRFLRTSNTAFFKKPGEQGSHFTPMKNGKSVKTTGNAIEKGIKTV